MGRHVAYTREMRNVYINLSEVWKGSFHLKEINKRIILKWILRKDGVRLGIEFIWLKIGSNRIQWWFLVNTVT
jgi:hypothetical protein